MVIEKPAGLGLPAQTQQRGLAGGSQAGILLLHSRLTAQAGQVRQIGFHVEQHGIQVYRQQFGGADVRERYCASAEAAAGVGAIQRLLKSQPDLAAARRWR